MEKSQDTHRKYLDSIADEIIKQNLEIERDWLQSIHAPMKQLPKHVANAVFTRVLYSSLPGEMVNVISEIASVQKLLGNK